MLSGNQAAGLSVEIACRGFEAAASDEQKVSGFELQLSRASKQQAGNLDLGMVAPRRGSRSKRVKGRCEKPVPDRYHQQADLPALIRSR